MLPASFSSCLPETLYRLRSRSSLHLPMPHRSLISHIVSASFSLLVEGKKENHHHPAGAPSPSEKQNQTCSWAPAPEGLAERGASGQPGGARTKGHGREAPAAPGSVPAAGRSSAPAPRAPPPRPPLSREPAEHTSIDGLAHPGEVSLQLARARRLPAVVTPSPGHGRGAGRGGRRGSPGPGWGPRTARRDGNKGPGSLGPVRAR